MKKVGIEKRFFKVIVSRKINLVPKPSPQPVILAVRKIPHKSKKIYFVGDEPSDIIAAKKAEKLLKGRKIITIGTPGWVRKKELKKSNPDYVVNNLEDLTRIL